MDMRLDLVFLDHMLHEITYFKRVCANKSIEDLYLDENLQHMISRAFLIIW